MTPNEIHAHLVEMGLTTKQIAAVARLVVKTLGTIAAKPFWMVLNKLKLKVDE